MGAVVLGRKIQKKNVLEKKNMKAETQIVVVWQCPRIKTSKISDYRIIHQAQSKKKQVLFEKNTCN